MHVIPLAGSAPPSKDKAPVGYVHQRTKKKLASEACGSTPNRKSGPSLPVNPLEPVHASWSTLKPALYEEARMNFNPYAFGQRTCNDSRFHCKMHQQVYEFKVCKDRKSVV